MIDPLVVGGGKQLFPDDGALRPLQLLENEVTAACGSGCDSPLRVAKKRPAR
jgi:hypothetical protein